jgi:hypothetical protein
MALTYKVLGNAATTTAGTALYTVPASTSAVLSTIIVCNTSTSSKTFRVAVTPASGTTLEAKYYLAYDTVVPANDSIIMTLGITLATGNTVRVSGSTVDVGFTAFGSEIS